MVKFAIKVVILAAAFYVLTKYDVLSGLHVQPNPNGPLGLVDTVRCPASTYFPRTKKVTARMTTLRANLTTGSR